jgi:hypothetical protein
MRQKINLTEEQKKVATAEAIIREQEQKAQDLKANVSRYNKVELKELSREIRRKVILDKEQYKKGISEYEASIINAKAEVGNIKSQLSNYSAAVNYGKQAEKIWKSLDKSLPREVALRPYSGQLRSLLEDYYDLNQPNIEQFNKEISQFQANNPSEKLLVDYKKLEISGVESGSLGQSIEISRYNKKIEEINKQNKLALLATKDTNAVSSAYPEKYPAGTPVYGGSADIKAPKPITRIEQFNQYASNYITAKKEYDSALTKTNTELVKKYSLGLLNNEGARKVDRFLGVAGEAFFLPPKQGINSPTVYNPLVITNVGAKVNRLTKTNFLPDTPFEVVTAYVGGQVLGKAVGHGLGKAGSLLKTPVAKSIITSIFGKTAARLAPKLVAPVFAWGVTAGGTYYAAVSPKMEDRLLGLSIAAGGVYGLSKIAKGNLIVNKLSKPRTAYTNFIGLKNSKSTTITGTIKQAPRTRTTQTYWDYLFKNPAKETLVRNARSYDVRVVIDKPEGLLKNTDLLRYRSDVQKVGSNVIKTEKGFIAEGQANIRFSGDSNIGRSVELGKNTLLVSESKGYPVEKFTKVKYGWDVPVEGNNPVRVDVNKYQWIRTTGKENSGLSITTSKPSKITLFEQDGKITVKAPVGESIKKEFGGYKAVSLLFKEGARKGVAINLNIVDAPDKASNIISKSFKPKAPITFSGDSVNNALKQKGQINLGQLTKPRVAPTDNPANIKLPATKALLPSETVPAYKTSKVSSSAFALLGYTARPVRAMEYESVEPYSLKMSLPDSKSSSNPLGNVGLDVKPLDNLKGSSIQTNIQFSAPRSGELLRGRLRSEQPSLNQNRGANLFREASAIRTGQAARSQSKLNSRLDLRQKINLRLKSLLTNPRPINPKIHTKIRIPFTFSKSSTNRLAKSKVTPSSSKYDVYVRNFGKDIRIENNIGLEKAKSSLRANLLDTLRASGFIQRDKGERLTFEEAGLGDLFRPSKKESGRIVQRRLKRLGSFGERKEIIKSRKGIKWINN